MGSVVGAIDAAAAKITVTMTGDLPSVLAVRAALGTLGSLEQMITEHQDKVQSAVAMLEDVKTRVEVATATLQDLRAQGAEEIASTQLILDGLRSDIQVADTKLIAAQAQLTNLIGP